MLPCDLKGTGRMAIYKIRYFTARQGRNGKQRFYWQPSTALQAAGWKVQRLSDNRQEAAQEAENLNKNLDNHRRSVAPEQIKQDSVQALILLYKKSFRFTDKTKKTQSSYNYAFRIILAWAADLPVTAITPRKVQALYQSINAHHPAKAAAVIRTLRLLLEFARREDIIVTNPASRPGIKNTAKKGVIWSTEAVNAFVRLADDTGFHSIGTAVFLNQWLGQRKGDILTLSATAYKNGKLYKKQSKTGAEVILPIDQVPELKHRMDTQIAFNKRSGIPSTVLIAGINGQPYSDRHFTQIFTAIRDAAASKHPELKIDKLVFKDLRHTAVTRLAESGCSTPMIASITGHSFRTCEEIVDRYNIRTIKMAEEAFKMRLTAETLNQ